MMLMISARAWARRSRTASDTERKALGMMLSIGACCRTQRATVFW